MPTNYRIDCPTLAVSSSSPAQSISSMRASVRPPIPRSSSDNQISISQEVTVSSQPDIARQRPTCSDDSSAPSHTAKAQSSREMRNTLGQKPRTNYLLSREFVDWSETQSEREGRRNYYDSQRGRESMKELAEFLTTKEPPPNNWMSAANDTLQSERKVPFKFFNLKFSKKPKDTYRPFKLPDSAVAAKTTSGHWHIAITIPKEYDLLDDATSSHPIKPEHQPNLDCGNFKKVSGRALRPVIEERRVSFADNNLASYNNSASPVHQIGQSRQKSSTELSKSNLYNPDHRSQLDYIPVSFNERSCRDSQRSDQRHSAGTVYSVRTLDTSCGHSRGPSSISTAPSLHQHISQHLARRPELPLRSSSIRKKISTLLPGTGSKLGEPLGSNEVKTQLANDTSSDLAGGSHELSDKARNYGPDTARSFSRNALGIPGPAPTKKLPDLPEGSEYEKMRRRGSLHVSVDFRDKALPRIPSNVGLPKSSDYSIAHKNQGEPHVRTLTRQERVKAIRARDMAALKNSATNASCKSLSEEQAPNTARVRSPSVTIPFPDNQDKRRSLTFSPPKLDRVHHKPRNAVSRVMLVADTAPYREYTRDDWVEGRRSGHRTRRTKSITNSSIRDSLATTNTPPRSISPSLASSDDEKIYSPRLAARNTGVPSRSRSIIGNPRDPPTDRGTKPNTGMVSARASVGSLEGRVAKLEKTNAAMLQTLGAVVQVGASFKDLQSFLPPTSEKRLEITKPNPNLPQAQQEIKPGFVSEEPAARNPKSTESSVEALQKAGRVDLNAERVEQME